jgi:hypothetical protein
MILAQHVNTKNPLFSHNIQISHSKLLQYICSNGLVDLKKKKIMHG